MRPNREATRLARDLHMLAALTRRVLEQGEKTGRSEASFAQLTILRWLDAANPRRAGEVARFLSASAPAATQMLARLKQKGLIRSRPSTTDRRAGELHLTPAGRALLRRHNAAQARRLDRLIGKIPPPERNRLAGALEAAIGILIQDRPSVADLCLHCGAHASPECVMRRHGFRCPV